MGVDLSKVLVVGISSRALFDLASENQIYEQQGLEVYREHQRDNEDVDLKPCAGFPLVKAMLRLNKLVEGDRRCEVVLLSKNHPDISMRIFNAIRRHDLDITRTALVGGAALAPYLHGFDVDLFLSKDHADVQAAVNAGIAAAIIYDAPESFEADLQQIRIAFDGDAVLFSDESERIYKEKGLEAFLEHEKENARQPLREGPFAKLFRAIAILQAEFDPASAPIRTALVTARNSPAQERVIRTLHLWGVRVDEAFFLGGVQKDRILQAFRPHIFFDDQDVHVEPASKVVPAARVPYVAGAQGSLFTDEEADNVEN